MDFLASAYGGDFSDADALETGEQTSGVQSSAMDDIERDEQEESASVVVSRSFKTSSALSIAAAPPVITDTEKVWHALERFVLFCPISVFSLVLSLS
jgi:hypothetical protein